MLILVFNYATRSEGDSIENALSLLAGHRAQRRRAADVLEADDRATVSCGTGRTLRPLRTLRSYREEARHEHYWNVGPRHEKTLIIKRIKRGHRDVDRY